MAYLKTLFIITSILILNACCKPAPCIAFSEDEMAWIPYKDGDTFNLKSDLTGKLYKYTAKKINEGTTAATCHEGQNYCLSYLTINIETTDSLGTLILRLDNENNYKHKEHYSMQFKTQSTIIFTTNGDNSKLQTKVINGITYNNVMAFPRYDNKYMIYYAKTYGLIAFKNIATNEWLYKQ